MADKHFTDRQVELIADMLMGKIVEAAPPGLVWILLCAEPGYEGQIRSAYPDRASVAQALRATLEGMGDA